MKKIRICLEVQGLWRDDHGTPCPAAICVTLGDTQDEEMTDAEYKKFLSRITIEEVLQLVYLDERISPAACRLITPAEYDRDYSQLRK